MLQHDGHRFMVVIMSVFTGFDDPGHDLSDDRPVFVLVAAGADGQIKTIKIGFVILSPSGCWKSRSTQLQPKLHGIFLV